MAFLNETGLRQLWAGAKEKFVHKADVVNDLSTAEAGYVLDARQGEALKTLVDNVAGSKASTALYTVTLGTEWSTTAPYTQTVAVSGLLATDTPFVDVVLSDTAETAEAQLEAWGFINRMVAHDDELVAYCYDDRPTVEIPIQLKVVR